MKKKKRNYVAESRTVKAYKLSTLTVVNSIEKAGLAESYN